MKIVKETLSVLLSMALMSATVPMIVAQDQPQNPPQDQTQNPAAQQGEAQEGQTQDDQQNGQPPVAQPAPSPKSPAELDQMVAPIALYPDELVAQILAASTYPDQVVEADRWVDAHPDLKGKELGDAVDQQPWDQSVKALTAFPSVLANMDKNLSWTSSLGEAYVNQQQDVMNAVQRMRQKAKNAGNLSNNDQERVSDNAGDIEIQPANPQVVYVPTYDPWLVYGPGLAPWPGWYWYPGLYFTGPGIGWGLGFGIGWFGGFGWGWGHWGFDWHRHYVWFDHHPYYSHSAVIFNHNNFYRGRAGFVGRGPVEHGFVGRGPEGRGFEAPRGGAEFHGGAEGRAFTGGHTYAQPHDNGTRSGAFSGYGRNGSTHSFSSRGASSFGGHGGGSSHGGGGHGGGGGRR